MTRISIVIPTWSAGGVGHEVIKCAFESIIAQDFKDFEVIVSDQSEDDLTENVCKQYGELFELDYFREDKKRGYFTANENNAIKHCNSEIIKFLDADDYLADNHALQIINDEFDNDTNWMATDYLHTYNGQIYFNRHAPSMNDRIYLINTIGTPSCVAIRNDNPPLFDENLRWAGDCEYYGQLVKRWGNPKLVNKITVVHVLWAGQVENQFGASNELQTKENIYIMNKYEGINH